jgi:hypothetical protein
MSKYIPKSRIKTAPFTAQWSNNSQEYFTFGSSSSKKEEYVNPLIGEKERIESIPLEDLSFRDLYGFPFHEAKYGSWVYDAKGNFIFQFEFTGEDTRKKVLDIINGDLEEYNRQEVKMDNGVIFVNDNPFILIRGWGNLTGVGAYNLDGDYAAKIQDTLAEYITEKLSK